VQPATEVVVAKGSVWRYLDDGSDQGIAWRAPPFDDHTWNAGPAELGYGDGDERTVVSYGTNASRKHKTTYFRHTFELTDAHAVTAASLGLRRDDGAAVYLNGTEVARSNLPTGPLTYQSDATTWSVSETAYAPFDIPATLLVEGLNTLAVEIHQNGWASSDISFDLQLTATRTTTPSTTTTTAPTTTTTAPTTTTTAPTTTTTVIPSVSGPLYVAGDIADCGLTEDQQVAALLAEHPDGAFLALGDLAYPDGRLSDFTACYDPNFGPFKSRTRPLPGNHEYQTPGASGFFDYFGPYAPPGPGGYSSFRVGEWLVLLLNSNCGEGPGCEPGGAMYEWVRAQLTENPTACLAAAWHHAPFSSQADYYRDASMDSILSLLRTHGLDVLLNGHAHNYERFIPLDASGQPDAAGYRAFVVGTGGAMMKPFGTPLTISEARNDTDHGLLELRLDALGYSWSFLPVAGATFTDSGSGSC
jgi:hypothetical protein